MHDTSNIEALVKEAEGALSAYHTQFDGLDWRGKVHLLIPLSKSIKKLGVNSYAKAAKVGARERIRLYLTAHVMTVIHAEELEVVSGISEYGRRARELRVEDGYRILTGHSKDLDIGIELTPKQYLLIDAEPDRDAAHRWKIANRIRNKDGSATDRIIEYLKANVEHAVTTEELAYVAKVKQYGRRTRELRTEQGYAVATSFTGRPDLRMGEYVLESVDRIAHPHDRNITFDVQKEVYERDQNRCCNCGWSRNAWGRDDPRILELHHLKSHVEGGHNSSNNLIVLCSRCHDELHAERLTLPADILPVTDG